MASGMVSRWPVVVDATLEAADIDADGHVTRRAIERLFEAARGAYFDQCVSVGDTAPVGTVTAIRQRGSVVAGARVTVAVGVVEIYETRFTMAARIYSGGENSLDIDATCSVCVESVTSEMRVEFIALAHAATHIA